MRAPGQRASDVERAVRHHPVTGMAFRLRVAGLAGIAGRCGTIT